jgi:hypothetical protein
MIALNKEPKATKGSSYRIISLISHPAKTLVMILRRFERKIEDVLGEDQFGFGRGKGTRVATGMLIISEHTLTRNIVHAS